jgi:hypothetical protein
MAPTAEVVPSAFFAAIAAWALDRVFARRAPDEAYCIGSDAARITARECRALAARLRGSVG